MKGRNTYVLSTRIPDELYEKVKRLAERRNMTMSDWVKVIVANAAKYRLNNDSVASHKGSDAITPTTTALTVVKEESNG